MKLIRKPKKPSTPTSKPKLIAKHKKPTPSLVPALKLKQGDGATKIPVSIRLDENIVTYFKDTYPKGYQSEINRVLAEYVTEQA